MTNPKSINVNKFLVEDSKLNGFHFSVMILLGLLFMIDGYDMFVYGGTVPLLLKAFHMGPAYAGVVGSYSLMGAAIGAVGLGSLADKIGRKYTILSCFTVFCIVMGLSGFTNDPVLFGVCRVICGIGIGGTMPNIVALVSDYTPLENRAWVIAAVGSGMPLGAIVAPAISMWLLPLYGWRSVYFAGIVPILLLPLAIALLPESPAHLIKKNKLAKLRIFLGKACPKKSLPADCTLEITQVAGKTRAPIIELFREKRGLSTVFLWLVYFAGFFQVYGMGVWMPKLMMNKGFSLGKGLWFLLVLNVGAFVFTHVGGWVGDRIGPKPTIIIFYTITFPAIALLAYSNGVMMLTILALVAGAGNSGAMNVAHGYVSAYYPHSARSTGLGFAWGVGRCGAILGPVIGGVLLSVSAHLSVIFLIIGLMGVFAAVVFALVQNKYSFTYVSRQAAAKQAELTQA